MRLNPAILASDDAIVAVVAHECHEVRRLFDAFARSGGRLMPATIHGLVDPAVGSLHSEAWDAADALVERRLLGTDPT